MNTNPKDVGAAFSADQLLAGIFHDWLERSAFSMVVVLHAMHNVDFEPHVDRVIAPLGWYISRIDRQPHKSLFYLESRWQPPVAVAGPVYHASQVVNRGSIIRAGLKPSSSSSTWTDRRYGSVRIHFATSMAGALNYVESRVRGGAAPDGFTRGSLGRAREGDIYRIDPDDENYHEDAEMTGGVWSTAAVPPGRLHRIPNWRVRLCAFAVLAGFPRPDR